MIMDAGVVIILLAEAALCMLILYFEGLLRRSSHVVTAAVLVVAAFGVRLACMSHVTLDYENFLAGWVQFFRENGGFRALSQSVGNYNVPYLYFLAAFSYSSMNDLYLIKLLSIFFDVMLAWGATHLANRFVGTPGKLLGCFFGVLLLPTVVLNGAYWGQCDSIYAAFALWAVYFALEKHPVAAMVCAAVSFGFKLQAVFILPFFVVLLAARRMKLWHFLVFPIAYVALVLPAVLLGRPLWDTVTLYFSQMGSVGGGLNYNSPSVFAFAAKVQNTKLAGYLGIAAAALLVLAVILWVWKRRGTLSDITLLGIAVLLCIGIPFLLPHMHDRYFFLADIFSLVFGLALPWYGAVPVLVQFASLNSYLAYLRNRFLLYMPYGAAAMAVALLLIVIFTGVQLRETGRRRT